MVSQWGRETQEGGFQIAWNLSEERKRKEEQSNMDKLYQCF